MIILPNGVGETLGDTLVTSGPLQASGSVLYVSSVTGDSGSTGVNKARPIDNLTNALTAASNGDIIVLLDGHTETLAGAITISKNVVIVASGSASGIPSVTFTASGSGYNYFTITGAGVQLRNIKFLARAVSDSTPRVLVNNVANVRVIGCYFDCSGLDTGAAISVAASTTGFCCESSTFVATNTAANPAPGPGIDLAGATTDTRLKGLVFDGGTHGFTGGYGYSEFAAPTRRFAEQISMLRGADAFLSTTAAQSFWQPTSSSADARIAT